MLIENIKKSNINQAELLSYILDILGNTNFTKEQSVDTIKAIALIDLKQMQLGKLYDLTSFLYCLNNVQRADVIKSLEVMPELYRTVHNCKQADEHLQKVGPKYRQDLIEQFKTKPDAYFQNPNEKPDKKKTN